ncbi:MAG: hypothetical protein ACYSU0_07250 [Planctomycetota bacterium]
MVTPLDGTGLKSHDVYLLHMFPIAPPMTLLVAVSKAKDSVHCLTDSLDTFGEVLRGEGVEISSEGEAERWVRRGVRLTSPGYGPYLLLDSYRDILFLPEDTSLKERAKRDFEDVIKPLAVRKKANADAYVATGFFLIGHDLVKRTMEIGRTGGIVSRDEILREDITFLDPHF